jgi:hypothetical protein
MFELGVQDKNQAIVFEALRKMAKIKKFSYSDNYKFMKQLSNYYFLQKPLYLYPADYKRNPFLRSQIEIIIALENEDYATSDGLWSSLSQVYGQIR